MEEEKKKSKKKTLKKILIIIAVFILIIILYSHYIGTKGLNVNEYKITTTKLNDKYDSLKIVQFGDILYGHITDSKVLEKVINKINKQNPDIVIFTGDLISSDIKISDKEISKIINILNKLDPKIETVCIKGDNDYKSKYWNKIIPYLNWIEITNNYETIYKDKDIPLLITGIGNSSYEEIDYNTVFSYFANSPDYYNIVVLHEGDQVKNITDYNFDLVLAGHSLNGQIKLPFIGSIIKKEGSKIYFDEHYKVNEKDMYITNGIGTTKLEARLFNRPSINLFRVYTK